MPSKIDLIGKRFGRLIVLSESHIRNKKIYWNCICDCRAACKVEAQKLRIGHTRSCGCLQREIISSSNYLHGNAPRGHQSQEYSTWLNMRQRCSRESNDDYALYGGRGIKVCRRWEESFSAFLSDMGPKPVPDLSIDRKDSDGDYEPGNCRWATAIEQANNTRTNRRITYAGETRTLAEWARRAGLPYNTLRRRLNRGWSISDTLSVPKKGVKS